jgi:hypothetical protein
MEFYKNKKIVTGFVLVFVVSLVLFIFRNKFMKTENFRVLGKFDSGVATNKNLETIILNSETELSNAFVYIGDSKIIVEASLPLSDGGDYHTSEVKYSVYGDGKMIGNLKRNQDGWLRLEIMKPTKVISKYQIKVGDIVYLQN